MNSSPPAPTTEPGAFLLSSLLICARCGGVMVGFRTSRRCKPERVCGCGACAAHGTAACVRVQTEEEWIAKQVIAELRDRLLLPEQLEWLAQRLKEKVREQRSDANLTRLRKAVSRLEAQQERKRHRLMEVSKDLLPDAEAARKSLWMRETAREGDNRCLLKEALRGILAGVVIGAEPYQTTTGKTRRRARIDGIRPRPGSGLDTLSMRLSSCSASTR